MSAAERAQLEQWIRSRISPHRVVVRSRIILLASRGVGVGEIAATLRVAPATVRLWTKRFENGGLAALTIEAPGRGRPRGASSAGTLAVLHATRALLGTGVSVRRVAALAGTSASTVWRTWRRCDLDAASTGSAIDGAIKKVISETPE